MERLIFEEEEQPLRDSMRRIFGHTDAGYQMNRFNLAAMRTEIDITRTFVDTSVIRHNGARRPGEPGTKARLFASEPKGRLTKACTPMQGGTRVQHWGKTWGTC